MRRRITAAIGGTLVPALTIPPAAAQLPPDKLDAVITGVDRLVARLDSATLSTWVVFLLLFLLPAIGFLGKWLFDQYSSHLKIQREFGAQTAKDVASLSRSHYWTVANASGTLAHGLRAYLRQVEITLYLDLRDDSLTRRDHAAMREALRVAASDASRALFPHLVRLVWHLDSFQFRGSNTYLLPSHGAGQQLRRLYNRFMGLLPPAEGGSSGSLAATILLQTETKAPRGKDGAADIGSSRIGDPAWLAEAGLTASQDRFATWLRDQLPRVVEATEALEAFARLFSSELARLHRAFFHDRHAEDDVWLPERAVARDAWPGILTAQDIATLRRVREQSAFFGSMGAAPSVAPAAQAPAAPPPPSEPADEIRASPPSQPPPRRTGVEPALKPPDTPA